MSQKDFKKICTMSQKDFKKICTMSQKDCKKFYVLSFNLNKKSKNKSVSLFKAVAPNQGYSFPLEVRN